MGASNSGWDAEALFMLDEAIRTSIDVDGGETVEGAFVDRYESFAGRAHDELRELIASRGPPPDFTDRLVEAVRKSPERFEAATRLLVAATPNSAEAIDRLAGDENEVIRTIGAAARTWSRGFAVGDGLDDASPKVRACSLATAIEHRPRDPETRAALLRALRDPDAFVRKTAAPHIPFFRDPEGQAAILSLLESELDDGVRRLVLLSFARTARRIGIHVGPDALTSGIGNPIFEALLAALEHDDPLVREEAAMAMHRFHGVRVANRMLERLRVETDPKVRFALVRFNGFGQIQREAFPVLAEVFQKDPSPAVRVWTGFLFAGMGIQAEPLMIGALSDPFEGVHRPAAMSLGKIGTLRALPALMGELGKADDTWYRRDLERAIDDIVITAAHGENWVWPEGAASKVQALIDALDPIAFGEWPARVCKVQLHALPLWGRGIDLWALRPDGSILCLDLDSVSHASWEEEDPLVRFAVMTHGAENYPGLATLLPVPPKCIRICPDCSGLGSRRPSLGESGFCLTCAGLGWFAN